MKCLICKAKNKPRFADHNLNLLLVYTVIRLNK